MFAEVKTLVIQFATIVGLWIIAAFIYTRFVKPQLGNWRKNCPASQVGALVYNSYRL